MKESLHFAGLPRRIPAQCNSAGHCCIERSRRPAASTCMLKRGRSWECSGGSRPSQYSPHEDSLHFTRLRRRLSAQCNSAAGRAMLPLFWLPRPCGAPLAPPTRHPLSARGWLFLP
jgi:hypothetical protein